MKSRSNSNNKAEKQMFEYKAVEKNKLLLSGNRLCLQRLSYKSTEELIKKEEAQKLIYFWK